MNSNYDQFLQASAQSRSGKIFKRKGKVVSHEEISSAEFTLGIELPESYKAFLTILGHGAWCDEVVIAPSELYAFDEECGEMTGFIALVENLDGLGDYLAINPTDPIVSGERPVYYCGHDPFGYAPLADSFELWTRMALDARHTGSSIYKTVHSGRWTPPESLRDARQEHWWQFWRS